MASLSKDGKVVFYVNKKKKQFRVGRLNKKARQSVLNKVESILSYKAGGEPFPDSIVKWLADRPRWLLDAMAGVGLIDKPNDSTLIEYFDAFIEQEKDSNGRDWEKNQNNTRNIAKRYFGDRTLRGVSDKDAQAFRDWMATQAKPVPKGKPPKGYAQATVSGHVKIIKKVYKAAVKEKAVYSNPFADVEAGDQSNSARSFEITKEMAQKILDTAPNAQWRLLIALVRFGGLRTGSETRALKWEHVDWSAKKITVPGSKGRRKNADGSKVIRWREIPIYPELEPYLKDAFNPEHEYVLHGITGTDAFVYREFKKIVKNAGLVPWERLWHNLRASRDSELTASGVPEFAVAALMGNSVQTSRKHYKFIPKDLFDSLSGTEGVPVVGTKPPATTDLEGNQPQPIHVFPGIQLDPEESQSDQYT